MRAADVEDFFYLSLSLCCVDGSGSFPVHAPDRRGGMHHWFGARWRDRLPKVPSRRVLYHVLESLAHKLDFVPVQGSSRRGAVKTPR